MRGAFRDEFCQKCRAKGSAGCRPGGEHLVETRQRSTTHTDAWGNSHTVTHKPERTWALFDPYISPYCKHPEHLKTEAIFAAAMEKVHKLNVESVQRLKEARKAARKET